MDANDIRDIQYGERWGGETGPTYLIGQIPPESRQQAEGVFKEWALVREGRQGMIAASNNAFETKDEAHAWLHAQGLRPI